MGPPPRPAMLGAAAALLAFVGMPAWRQRGQVVCGPGFDCPAFGDQDRSLLALLLQPSGGEFVATPLPLLALALAALLGGAVAILAQRAGPPLARWLRPQLRPDGAKALVAGLGVLGLVGALRNWFVLHGLALPGGAMAVVDALDVAVLPFTLAATLLLRLAAGVIAIYGQAAGVALAPMGAEVWYLPLPLLAVAVAMWAALAWPLGCLAVEGWRRLRRRRRGAGPAAA